MKVRVSTTCKSQLPGYTLLFRSRLPSEVIIKGMQSSTTIHFPSEKEWSGKWSLIFSSYIIIIWVLWSMIKAHVHSKSVIPVTCCMCASLHLSTQCGIRRARVWFENSTRKANADFNIISNWKLFFVFFQFLQNSVGKFHWLIICKTWKTSFFKQIWVKMWDDDNDDKGDNDGKHRQQWWERIKLMIKICEECGWLCRWIQISFILKTIRNDQNCDNYRQINN